jgi:hypothetical protein
MTAEQLEQVLSVVANKAKSLRDVGIVGRVTVGDISFELADAEPATPADSHRDGAGNPIDDGDTYGGSVPRRRVQAYADDEFDDGDLDQE